MKDSKDKPKKIEEAPKDPKSFGGDKKFYRDGAKYVCGSCKQKFFTRVEVEKCFDSHEENPPKA